MPKKKEEQFFIREGGKLVHRTVTTVELEDTGCIYIALPINRKKGKDDHCIYKLHSVKKITGGPYRWIGLWNTCCYHGPSTQGGFYSERKHYDHKTIQSAIEWIEENGFKVVRVHFDDLISDYNLDSLYLKAKL